MRDAMIQVDAPLDLGGRSQEGAGMPCACCKVADRPQPTIQWSL